MTNEIIQLGQLEIRFLLDGPAGDGLASAFEFDVPAGARVPAAHSHDGYEETIVMLRGSLTWTVAGEERELAEGEAMCIRRGVVHAFRNDGDADATALAVVTPGVLGPAYFHEVAAILDDAAGGPPDLARLVSVMQRHGLSPA